MIKIIIYKQKKEMPVETRESAKKDKKSTVSGFEGSDQE